MSETLVQMLQRLYQEQYTGSLVVEFGQGVPAAVEIPCEPKRIRLAKPPRRSVDSTLHESGQN